MPPNNQAPTRWPSATACKRGGGGRGRAGVGAMTFGSNNTAHEKRANAAWPMPQAAAAHTQARLLLQDTAPSHLVVFQRVQPRAVLRCQTVLLRPFTNQLQIAQARQRGAALWRSSTPASRSVELGHSCFCLKQQRHSSATGKQCVPIPPSTHPRAPQPARQPASQQPHLEARLDLGRHRERDNRQLPAIVCDGCG